MKDPYTTFIPSGTGGTNSSPGFTSGHEMGAWPVRAPHTLNSGDRFRNEHLAQKETKGLNSGTSVKLLERQNNSFLMELL